MTYHNTNSFIQFGASSIRANTTPRYLWAGDASRAASVDIEDGELTIPVASTITALSINTNGSADVDTVSYVLLVNGVASSLVASAPATEKYIFAEASVDLAAGDTISIRVDKDASVNPQVQEVRAVLVIHTKTVT